MQLSWILTNYSISGLHSSSISLHRNTRLVLKFLDFKGRYIFLNLDLIKSFEIPLRFRIYFAVSFKEFVNIRTKVTSSPGNNLL